jgi:D-glycero-D-manno-heptose 1,7-bisphosphate phosphatase
MQKKAIFLDRDGVLLKNSDHYYIWEMEQMEFVDGVFENLRLFIMQGFQLFIVSNQGGISKGIYTKADIMKLHDELILSFKKKKIQIQEIIFCPHHPEIERCICRKPDSQMIDKLIAKYKLSKSDSFFIGDCESDMKAARKAGIQGIKIVANRNMYPFISFLIK